MFITHIDGKEVKVTFQHQKAAWRGQLTRPDVQWYYPRDEKGKKLGGRELRSVRIPVFAVCFCFFNELCVGVAFCSYADERCYSKEIGRQVALRNALKGVLRRSGRKDRIVASERAQVWDSYFRASTRRAKTNPLVIGRALHRMAAGQEWLKSTGAEAEGKEWLESQAGAPSAHHATEVAPFPTEKDMNHSGIPWKLGHMNEDVRSHLNNEDINNSTIE